MTRRILMAGVLFVTADLVWAQQKTAPSVANFTDVTQGRYQVLAQSGHQLAFEVNLFMNGMLDQYEKFFDNWSGKSGARVIVFETVNDFQRYASNTVSIAHAGLAGYCRPTTDAAGKKYYELVSYQDAHLWRALAHEGFHQFIGYELGQQIPIWLNEGMAEYFETSFVTGSRFNVGQVSRGKLFEAQYLITNRKAPPLAQIMQWDQATFYANADVAYPMSWALVYYLLNGNNERLELGQFRHFLQDLKLGKDDIDGFRKRFGQESGRWQANFEDYILHLKAQTD